MSFKIAIGVPTIGSIKSKTALSLIDTVRFNKDLDFLPIFRYGSYVSENRERIAIIAKEQGCTHLLFIDHDMKFHPSTIQRLLDRDKDIVGALYNYRYFPITPMNKFFKNGKTVATAEVPKDIFEVPAIGCGCLLIKMSVFDKIEQPYFPMTYDESGTVKVSEDVGFCEKVRKIGIKIWCDPLLNVKHIGDYEF